MTRARAGPTFRVMKGALSPTFGKAAEDYARFRAGFPESLFERLFVLGVGMEGKDVIDVGTGTGSLARGFAERGARVVGVDPDEHLLAEAKKLDHEARVSIEYRVGKAEALPFKDVSADVVTAGQCWHWFDAARAAREMARVARPGGRVVVAHFDWLPYPDSVVFATERLIEKHNPAWHFGGGNGVHPESVPDLRAAGFSGLEMIGYDVEVPYTKQGWRGRIRASAGVGASLSPEKVEAFDRELMAILEASFPDDVLQIPHRVFAVVMIRHSG